MSHQASTIRFAPLQNRIDISLWSELSERKLDLYKLSEEPVALHGSFGPSRYEAVSSQISLDGNSFATTPETRQGCHAVPGTATLLNTWDAFRDSDKAAELKQAAALVWADICSGGSEQSPSSLSRFTLLCYADLKLFQFHYWFGLPALKPPSPFEAGPAQSLTACLGQDAAKKVAKACDDWLRPAAATAAAAAGPEGSLQPATSQPCWIMLLPASAEGNNGFGGSGSGFRSESVQCLPLSAWSTVGRPVGGTASSSTGAPGGFLLAFSDPSSVGDNPGWPLRNLLLMVAVRMKLQNIQVLCVRESQSGRVDTTRSLILNVKLPEVPEGWCMGEGEVPDAVGWEANAEGKLLPRRVDLSPVMSPTLLAEQAVGLNLRLMRWRAAPDLEIQKMASTKCLLLGAGTLGCAVARCLLAWGVRTITLLDASKVSYSNPVRQWLYELKDCAGGGRPKAQAAAEALIRVFPSVLAEGRDLGVPMPGHAPANAGHEEEMRKAYEELDQLVSSHDVIFMLTDTRESRWLPSLLAAVHGKVAVTAAVGFDSFVVMRHGAPPGSDNGGPRLGCYFCNDVVGPLNSTNNRTLDQQCTVARPGLAPITSALAVELVAALLQHPDGVRAPASISLSGSSGFEAEAVEGAPALGPVPHMIRGQLSGFSQTCMVGHASSQCTACSSAVVDQCRLRGWPFILEALKDPKSLEQVSGLTALHHGMEDMEEWDGDDADGDSDAGIH